MNHFFHKIVLTTLLALSLTLPGFAAELTEIPSIQATPAAHATLAAPETPESPEPTPVTESPLQDDGIIRVDLRSLNAPSALHLTLDGTYAVEADPGFRFARNTQLTVAPQNGHIILEVGGMTLDMGKSFTLTRHAPDREPSGIYIKESEKRALYCGDLTLSVNDGGGLRAVLAIAIEDYLYGVVAYEMSDSFPLEALKAQAVAARTYAIQHKFNAGSRDYDVVDTTADQVYKGFDPQYTNVIEAVNLTRGVVGTYNGRFAECYYTASNGGQTARATDIWGGSGDYGYLDMHDDPYDLENPRSLVNSVRFQKDLSDSAALRKLLGDALSAAMNGSGALEYTLESVAQIEPAAPKFEGSYMYTQLAFTLNVRTLLPAPTPAPAEATPAPQRTPIDEPLNPAETGAQPTATPAAQSDADATESDADATESDATATESAATATESDSYSLTLPTPAPAPSLEPAWETQTVTVTLPVYDQLKDTLSLGLNGKDYELITAKQDGDAFVLEMRRFGHGVGMSQRGAQWMAGQYGMLYTEILGFYYPGMCLERIEWNTPALTALPSLPVGLGIARPDPTAKPTPAPLPALEAGEQYMRVKLSDSSSSLNVRETPSTDGRILDRFENNRRVILCGGPDAENWVKIRTAELTGYVKLDYLAEE